MIPVDIDFKNAIYAQTRQFDSRVTFNSPTNNIVNEIYLDDRIIEFNIVEEFQPLSTTIPANQCTLTMDNRDGKFNFLTFSNMVQILAPRPNLFFELGLYTATGVQWIPAGYFILESWKIDSRVQTVTLFGHDFTTLFSDLPWKFQLNYSNMTAVFQDIFNQAGITNYNLDPIVANFNTAKVISTDTNIDLRRALQLAAIATTCAIYQDRTGKIWVKAYPTISNVAAWNLYPTASGTALFRSPTTQYVVASEINDDGGNRRINLKDSFEFPQVNLEKSIYKLIINIYTNGIKTDSKEYTNSQFTGNNNNGISFTIDDIFIDIEATAIQIKDLYMGETNFNAVYECDWRQNPSIEAGDVVLIEDGGNIGGQKQSSTKVTRIYRQEFIYRGDLSGHSQARGGV